jgi:photosynthetic reaction center cytochrome c subunit
VMTIFKTATPRRTFLLLFVCLLGTLLARGQGNQPRAEQKPQMAEDAFKNVQVLRGIPVDQFMATMGFFSASLGLNCTECHSVASNDSLAAYADDTPRKQIARRMILMMNTINKSNFGGVREVTCYSCHRGDTRPKVTPSLAEQYSAPPDDPDEVERSEDAPKGPSVDQILDKYIQALGGAPRLASLTSFVGKGTYEGYDTGQDKVPFDLFVNAPSQRTTIAHTDMGDSTTTYDGHVGWKAAADKMSQVILLTGGELDGAKLDANLSFPARIKQSLSDWRTGFPATTIDHRKVQVIQGTTAGRTPVKLYFDEESGLLVRQVRYSDAVVGLNPTQIDYTDYRRVSGVKIPFRWIVTWTDGRSTFELSAVQPNVPIDSSMFAKPAPPKPKPATP